MSAPTSGKKLHRFRPDWSIHPGELLAEELAERGYTQAQACRELGFSAKHMNQVIKGKADIGPEMAWALGQWLGTTTAFWLRLQADHHAWTVDQKNGTRSKARARGIR